MSDVTLELLQAKDEYIRKLEAEVARLKARCAKLESEELRGDLSEELWKLLPGQRMAAYDELADAVLTFVRAALAEGEKGGGS